MGLPVEGVGLKTSIRGIVAVTVAIVAVIVSGVMGARATTAPEDLACRFVAVGIGEPGPGSGHPTAEAAAAAYAQSLGEIYRNRFPGLLGVTDVTGADTVADSLPEGGRIFAVRTHGRTIALVAVSKGSGSWDATSDYVC